MSWLTVVAFGALATSPEDGGMPSKFLLDGVVVLKGKAPKPDIVDVALDVDACGRKKTKPGLVVSRHGGIKDAVIVLVNAPADPTFPKALPAIINQQRCEFVPHLLVVPAGTQVTFQNDDALMHDVHVLSPAAPFNQSQVKGATLERVFAETGPVPVKCDFHVWMGAWVYVVGNRFYAVSDVEGRFRIADVPPGKQKLRLWHETLGAWEEEVDVPSKEPVRFELSSK
jgi:plastocyanin